MKISTKGRYALRLMLDLATEGNGKPVSIKDIAGRQDISEKSGADHFQPEPGRLCEERPRFPGRLSPENGSQRVHSRDDSPGD